METDLINIGDDYYLIIPDEIMEKCGFEDSVRIHVKDEYIFISKSVQNNSNN